MIPRVYLSIKPNPILPSNSPIDVNTEFGLSLFTRNDILNLISVGQGGLDPGSPLLLRSGNNAFL